MQKRSKTRENNSMWEERLIQADCRRLTTEKPKGVGGDNSYRGWCVESSEGDVSEDSVGAYARITGDTRPKNDGLPQTYGALHLFYVWYLSLEKKRGLKRIAVLLDILTIALSSHMSFG